MSKIICDVCGTSYPETATQCPICGCVRPSDVTVVAGDTLTPEEDKNGSYSHVKGGRFSKSNVRRRSHEQHGVVPINEPEEAAEPVKEKGSRDTGLVVAVCILLLAIVSAVIYIALHFFEPAQPDFDSDNDWQNTPGNTVSSSVETTDNDVVCTDILISKTSVELTAVGATCDLVVTKTPANTTEEVLFSSSAPAVATVSAEGKIVAVGAGEATITVTCGAVKAECKVVCRLETLDTNNNTEATAPNVTPEVTAGYKISHEDVTLKLSGEAHQKSFTLTLKDSDGNVKDVNWIVGDKSICSVSGNKVTALKTGYTKVKVTVDDVTYVCIVRVV